MENCPGAAGEKQLYLSTSVAMICSYVKYTCCVGSCWIEGVIYYMPNESLPGANVVNENSIPANIKLANAMAVPVVDYSVLMNERALLTVPACCRQTIRRHVMHNPMMVCSECKIMIKCFSDEKSYNNYVTFCRGRGRRIKSAIDVGFYFVMYNTYPMAIGSGG